MGEGSQVVWVTRVLRRSDSGASDLAGRVTRGVSLLAPNTPGHSSRVGITPMKRLRAGPPIHVNGVQLIPVERTCVDGNRTPELLTAVAAKEPVAS